MSCDHACDCTMWQPIKYPFHDTWVLTCVCGHARSQHSSAALHPDTLEQWDEITQPACPTCGTPTPRDQHCTICHPDQP